MYLILKRQNKAMHLYFSCSKHCLALTCDAFNKQEGKQTQVKQNCHYLFYRISRRRDTAVCLSNTPHTNYCITGTFGNSTIVDTCTLHLSFCK